MLFFEHNLPKPTLGGPPNPLLVLLAMWLDLVGSAQPPWTGGENCDFVGGFGHLQSSLWKSVVLHASLQQWRVAMYALAERSQGHQFGARVGPWCPDHGISFVFVVLLAKTCVNPLQPLEIGDLSLLTACLLTLGSSVTVLESTQGLILVYFCMLRGPSAYLVLLLMLSR